MGYCHSCGVYADLNQDTKMCGPCRRDWRPATRVDDRGDLGHRAQQPQPLGAP